MAATTETPTPAPTATPTPAPPTPSPTAATAVEQGGATHEEDDDDDDNDEALTDAEEGAIIFAAASFGCVMVIVAWCLCRKNSKSTAAQAVVRSDDEAASFGFPSTAAQSSVPADSSKAALADTKTKAKADEKAQKDVEKTALADAEVTFMEVKDPAAAAASSEPGPEAGMEMLPVMLKFFRALNAGDTVDGVLTADEMGSRITKKRLSYDMLPALVKEMNEADDGRLHPDEILDNVAVDDDGFVSVSALCRHMSSTMLEIRPEAGDAEEVELDGAAEDDVPDEAAARMTAMDRQMLLSDLGLGGGSGSGLPSEPVSADHMSRVECMKVLMKAKLPFQECDRDLGLLRKMVEEYHLVIPDPSASEAAESFGFG